MADCLFCKIAAGEIPAQIVYQDDQLLAFEDIAPKAPFHVLIIPRRHISTMADKTVESRTAPVSSIDTAGAGMSLGGRSTSRDDW